MKWWQILLTIIINVPWIYVFVYTVFISTFIDNYKYKKRRKQWDEENPNLERIKCANCRFCKASVQYFYGLPQRIPEYCSLIKSKIHKNSSCLIAEPPMEFCVAKNGNSKYSRDVDEVYFSIYGKYYHSSINCPSTRNPINQYSSRVGGLGRCPCNKCWEEKNGVLYPKY